MIFDNLVISLCSPNVTVGIGTWQQLKTGPKLVATPLAERWMSVSLPLRSEWIRGCSSQQNMTEVLLNGSEALPTQSLPGVLGHLFWWGDNSSMRGPVTPEGHVYRSC